MLFHLYSLKGLDSKRPAFTPRNLIIRAQKRKDSPHKITPELHRQEKIQKKGVAANRLQPLEYTMVPGARIELAQLQEPRDFKSLASTSSAIRAFAWTILHC